MKKYALVIIPLVAILAFWQIYKLYFGYEDLALFYMLQHRAEALAELAKQPNFNIYRHHFWLLPWQFKLFGYNPLPYYVISVLTYIGSGFTLYWFVRKLGSSKAALVAAAVFMSGYFGLETIWWSAFNGHQTYLVIILLLASTGFLIEYTKKKRPQDYLVSLVVFALTIFLFQFRAFLLIFPPLVTLAVFRRPLKRAAIEWLPYLTIFALVLFRAAGVGLGNISHSSTIPVLYGIKALFGNIGASFLPLGMVMPENITTVIYILGGLGLLGVLAHWGRRSVMALWLLGYIFFTSSVIAGSAFLAGSPILIYDNAHRFLTPIFLGIAITVGFGYELFSKQKYATAIIGAFVVANVLFANVFIATKSARHDELHTFYTSIKQAIPVLPDKAVLQFAFLKPSPGSFVPGYVVPPDAYLAGLYGKHVNDMKISRSIDESLNFLKQSKLNENHLFFFNYDHGAIEDLSSPLRDIVRTGKTTGQPSFVPALIELEVRATFKGADFSCPSTAKMLGQLHLKALQHQWFKNAKVTTVTMLDDHKSEDLIDGDYDTSWTARDWSQPVFFQVELQEPIAIDEVRWPTLPGRRAGRMPTVYDIELSSDGQTWRKLGAPPLDTPSKFIRVTIDKTLDGRSPQIDELDIFESPSDIKYGDDYKEFVELKKKPVDCFPELTTAGSLPRAYDNQVTLPIRWLTDADQTFRPERETNITIPADGKTHRLKVPLNFGLQAARDHEITKIEIGTPNLPADVELKNYKLIYPTLAELLK
ncbi:glycosyltransferase family 39 protein [Candidatus Berkelbacteria bacterium]|nr:glycosyltransferase family 39 protein [Candidatus Berkelbacteria bacterium]